MIDIRRGAVLLLVLAGCDARQASSRDSGDAPRSISSDEKWVMTPTGLAGVRAGSTWAEARSGLGESVDPDSATSGCHHVTLTSAPGRALAMIVEGRIARFEVKDSVIPTDRGARVGDPEARIDSLYRGRVVTEPHKYTDGHYLVVSPEAAADSAYRLIFETDGARVLEYRAGLLPAVAWVEGCS